jgi:hypothetical protein
MDGSGDYVELTPFEFGGVFSIETYFVMDISNDWQRVIEFGNGPLDNTIALTRHSNLSNLDFGIMLPDNTIAHTVISPFTDKTLHHVVCTMNTSGGNVDMKVYIDGNAPSVVTYDGSMANIMTRNNHYVGRSTWGGDTWGKGSVSYLRLWQGHALTQYEVNELYKQRDNKSYYMSSV